MVTRVVMEDNSVVVQMGEFRTFEWMKNGQFRNKRRDILFGTMIAVWNDDDFRTRIIDDGINVHGCFRMKRTLISSLLRVGQVHIILPLTMKCLDILKLPGMITKGRYKCKNLSKKHLM